MNRKSAVCFMLLAAMLMGLCSCAGAPAGLSDTAVSVNPETGAGAQEALTGVGDQEVLLTDGAQAQTASYALGSAVMTPAEGEPASVFYSPLGGAVSLELRDGAGGVWRLDIPENALPYGETISMRLCESVTTDVVSGKRCSGVIFQPDGLQFTIPATLTVTGPDVTGDTLVFFGDRAGENLSFASYTEDEDGIEAAVGHFSAYIVYTPTGSSEIEEAQGLAAEAYKAVLEEAKALLKTPVTAPPIPADYSFECRDEENASQNRNRELDAYIRSALDPEYGLAGRLVGAGYQVAQLGGETDAFYYAGLLLQRDLKKADKLIRTYRNDNDKLIPVMNLTFKLLKEMGALGADVPPGYMETFSEWMARAADDQIRKIREEHDYKALSPAIALAKGSAIMASDFSASTQFTHEFLEKIKKAMTFKVKYEVSLYSGLADQRMTLKGETEVSLMDENNENYYAGTGTGRYLTYSHSGPWTTTIDFPNEYPVKIKFVDFTPCDSKTVKVQADTIGADTEVWYSPELDERSADEYSFVNFMADRLFGDYKAESGGYVFEVPFQNKTAVMGEGNFAKTDSISYPEEGSAAGSISYSLEIKHTPK